MRSVVLLILLASSSVVVAQEHQTDFFNIKLTDLIIAGFTILIAVFTGELAKATESLSNISHQQEKSSKIHERAYVYGGGPYGVLQDERDAFEAEHAPKARYFTKPWRMTIQNYGRTPAFITKVEWGLCPKDKFPRGSISKAIDKGRFPPDIVRMVEHPADVFPPGADRSKPFLYRHIEFDRSAHVGDIFFGRIWYKDVFRVTHYSTFALLLTEDYSDSVGEAYADDWD